MTPEYFREIRKHHSATAELMAVIEAFGDELAKRRKYKKLQGIDAVYFYLIQTFNWMPK